MKEYLIVYINYDSEIGIDFKNAYIENMVVIAHNKKEAFNNFDEDGRRIINIIDLESEVD